MPLADPVDQPRSGRVAFGSADIEALVAYVASLGDGGGPQVPVVPAGEPSRGREVYLTNCAACHSSSGVGAVLPSGHVAPSLLDTPATQLAEAVRVGPGLMPQFPDGVLSDTDVADVAAYVDALAARQDHGGWAIGGVGPVSEGAVAWVLGLGTVLVVARLLGKRSR
jgi:ubiquinol-cytochrome c reductase cytochrome c subunit